MSEAKVCLKNLNMMMDGFNLTGIAEPEDEGETFSYDQLVEMAQKLQVEVQVQEEGEEILERLDPPPAWEIVRKEVIADFVLKIETAPDRPDLGKTIFFEDETQAFIYDHEQAFEALTQEMDVGFDDDLLDMDSGEGLSWQFSEPVF